MKFSAPIIAALAPSVVFARVVPQNTRDILEIEQRDLQAFTGVLDNVNTGINDLDKSVKAYTSGDGADVISVSKKLVSTINDGKTTVDGQPELSLSDALALQDPVKTLTASATTLVNDLTDKRDAIKSNGLCDTTRTQVGDINTSGNALIDSVVGKVPSAAQGIANDLVKDLRAQLDKAKENFSEANCPAS